MGTSRIRTTDEQKQLLARQIATSIARGRRVESQGDFQAVLLRGRRVNHLLHLILTLLTFWLIGGWIWVWIALVIFGGEKREIASVDEYGNVTLTKV